MNEEYTDDDILDEVELPDSLLDIALDDSGWDKTERILMQMLGLKPR